MVLKEDKITLPCLTKMTRVAPPYKSKLDSPSSVFLIAVLQDLFQCPSAHPQLGKKLEHEFSKAIVNKLECAVLPLPTYMSIPIGVISVRLS